MTNHLYADDTQIYLELDSRNFDSSITELTNCFEVVRAWMGNNKVKLNPDKTEFIVIGDDQIKSYLKLPHIIFPSEFAGQQHGTKRISQKPWCHPGCGNSMQRHVANLCHISHIVLWELQRVRR